MLALYTSTYSEMRDEKSKLNVQFILIGFCGVEVRYVHQILVVIKCYQHSGEIQAHNEVPPAGP